MSVSLLVLLPLFDRLLLMCALGLTLLVVTTSSAGVFHCDTTCSFSVFVFPECVGMINRFKITGFNTVAPHGIVRTHRSPSPVVNTQSLLVPASLLFCGLSDAPSSSFLTCLLTQFHFASPGLLVLCIQELYY